MPSFVRYISIYKVAIKTEILLVIYSYFNRYIVYIIVFIYSYNFLNFYQ
jgi:hypothetical protein